MRDLKTTDIPIADRYDLTLEKIGYADIKSAHPKVIIRCFIDNGQFTGKRVSHAFDFGHPDAPYAWRQFYEALGVAPKLSTRDKWKKLAPLVAVCKIARFSAFVEAIFLQQVDDKWKEIYMPDEITDDMIIKYQMDSFGEPMEEPEKILSRKNKFSRK